MTIFKRPSATFWVILLVLAGAAAVVAGVGIQFGLPWALIVGGAGAVAVGLTVDV